MVSAMVLVWAIGEMYQLGGEIVKKIIFKSGRKRNN